MRAAKSEPIPHRVGEWLPPDPAFLTAWLDAMIQMSHGTDELLIGVDTAPKWYSEHPGAAAPGCSAGDQSLSESTSPKPGRT
jgi:hypothetical protein